MESSFQFEQFLLCLQAKMKYLLIIFCSFILIHAKEPIQDMPVTFGTSISQGTFIPGKEYELGNQTGAGTITYFWCTEGDSDPVNVGETIFQIYIDGNMPLEFTLDMLAGIGFDDNTSPWGTAHFGKGANTGGVYSTMRIPYTNSIRVTGLLPSFINQPRTFWWVIRGITNYPIFIGNYQLPPTTQLKLYKNQYATYQPLEYVTLVNTTNAGAVWTTVLAVQSGTMNFLEGCFRMYTGGSTSPVLISSGTEDYFQSAFYFDGGPYHFSEAGLSHINSSAVTLSAYKVHNYDAFFFQSGGFIFQWRNGDNMDPVSGFKCVDKGQVVGSPTVSIVTTYTWVYEW